MNIRKISNRKGKKEPGGEKEKCKDASSWLSETDSEEKITMFEINPKHIS